MDPISPALGNLDLSNQVSIAVARKALDAQQQNGAAMVQLIRAAAEVQQPSQRDSAGRVGLDIYA